MAAWHGEEADSRPSQHSCRLESASKGPRPMESSAAFLSPCRSAGVPGFWAGSPAGALRRLPGSAQGGGGGKWQGAPRERNPGANYHTGKNSHYRGPDNRRRPQPVHPQLLIFPLIPAGPAEPSAAPNNRSGAARSSGGRAGFLPDSSEALPGGDNYGPARAVPDNGGINTCLLEIRLKKWLQVSAQEDSSISQSDEKGERDRLRNKKGRKRRRKRNLRFFQ